MTYNPLSFFFRALLPRPITRLGNPKPNIRYYGGELHKSVHAGFQWFHSYHGIPQQPRNCILQHIHHLTQSRQPQTSRLSTTTLSLKKGDVNSEPQTPKRIHKGDDSPVIILIDKEEKVSTTTLMQAGKMAKRRDLKLVKVDDPTLSKTKEVYKLLTGKEYYEQEMKARKDAKDSRESKVTEKKIVFTSKIGPSDLTNKLHNIQKWLMKGFHIQVYINSTGTEEDMGNTFSSIEREVTNLQGKLQQVHKNPSTVKFYIVPAKVKAEKVGKSGQKTHQKTSQEISKGEA